MRAAMLSWPGAKSVTALCSLVSEMGFRLGRVCTAAMDQGGRVLEDAAGGAAAAHVSLDMRPASSGSGGSSDDEGALGAGGGVPTPGARARARDGETAARRARRRREAPAAWRSGGRDGGGGSGSDVDSDSERGSEGSSGSSSDASLSEADGLPGEGEATPRAGRRPRSSPPAWLEAASGKEDIVFSRRRIEPKLDLLRDSRNLRFRELFHAPDTWMNVLALAVMIVLIVLGATESGPFSRIPRR